MLFKLVQRKRVQRDSPLIQKKSIQNASCITAKDIRILQREYLHPNTGNRTNGLWYKNKLLCFYNSFTNRNIFCWFQQIVEQLLLAPRDAGRNVRLGVIERTLAAGRTNASNTSEKTKQIGALLVAATLFVRKLVDEKTFTNTMRFPAHTDSTVWHCAHLVLKILAPFFTFAFFPRTLTPLPILCTEFVPVNAKWLN